MFIVFKEIEVLVKMKMVLINFFDINMIEGIYYMFLYLLVVCGNEGVGEVLEVGSKVFSFVFGDWVILVGIGFGIWRIVVVFD